MEVNVSREGSLEPENDFYCTLRTIHMRMECTQSTVTSVWGSICIVLSCSLFVKPLQLVVQILAASSYELRIHIAIVCLTAIKM